MKIVVSWLREFVDVTASPEELGETLSLRGFELASIEKGTGTFSDATDSGKGSRPLFDAVLDFEITANRPDALSVIGIAREAATAYSLPLKPPPVARQAFTGPADVAVTLEAADLCPRYAAIVADVTIAPSPTWLAARLQAAGVRPINNVVDVTNYVLLELGQPMHAFDLAKLKGGELRVRRARKGERITTLDGTDRELEPDMLVIADIERPQAIAGVMGGAASEVTSTTTTIAIESACFEPKSIRLTSKRLGMKTEASARFERGADVNAPVAGIERAVALLEQIGAGRARGGVIDRYPSPPKARVLSLRHARIARILGQEVTPPDVERILTGLGFAVQQAAGGWNVTIPTFRVDVLREVDLIEEVGRHHGYDRLPTTFPALRAPNAPHDPRIDRDRLVRRILLGGGCSEALTFSFIDGSLAASFADPLVIVPIGNPLSAQYSVLRPSLLPGLLTAVAHNRNRGRSDVRLFEIGATVTRAGEARRLALACTGTAGDVHWSGGRRNVDFFDVKGLVELIADALKVELSFDAASHPPFLVPGRAATISNGRTVVGVVGMVTTSAAPAGAADEDVYVAELDLDALGSVQSAPLKVTALPRFPSIARDISIVVDDVLPAAALRGTIRSNAPDTLVSVREFDRYQGKGVPERRVSLSFRLTFQSPDRTLTDSEVQKAMDAIIKALIDQHHAIQR